MDNVLVIMSGGRFIRLGEWKYVRHQDFGAELYNVVEDPDELVDLGVAADLLLPVRFRTAVTEQVLDRRGKVRVEEGQVDRATRLIGERVRRQVSDSIE